MVLPDFAQVLIHGASRVSLPSLVYSAKSNSMTRYFRGPVFERACSLQGPVPSWVLPKTDDMGDGTSKGRVCNRPCQISRRRVAKRQLDRAQQSNGLPG